MPKHGQKPNSGKTYGTSALGRSEQGFDDDRPFAEIRKTLHDGLRLLALHRWMFFVPFCLAACGAFVASLYIPRTYSATTSFEVRNDPVMINLPMSAGAASFKYFRNTMVRDLTSVECLADVVENLNLVPIEERNADGTPGGDFVRRRDSLARSLSGNVSVGVTSPSELVDIVKITYTGSDPTIGRNLVDQLKKSYIRRTTAWIREYLVSQRDYFLREVTEARGSLLSAERAETQLRLDNPHVNPTDPGAISTRLAQLESERRELSLRKREYETELDGLRQLLAASEPPSSDNAAAAVLIEPESASAETMHLAAQIQEIDKNVAKLRQTRGMTDHHPEIVEALTARRRLEEKLTEQRETDGRIAAAGIAPLPGAADYAPPAGPWQSDRARLMVQIAAQTSKIKDIDISLQSNEMALAELNQARDEVFLKQEQFAETIGNVHKARQKLTQVETTLGTIEPAIKAVEQDRLLQFSEGQPARGGSTPISPKALTVVLLSLVAGIAAGVVFVFLAEILDHVFRGSGQVSRSLGLPILEAIDEIVTGHDRRRFLVYHAVVTPLVILCCLGLTGLTGSMAYLSLTQPWTYQKIRHIPEAALNLLIEQPPPSTSTNEGS